MVIYLPVKFEFDWTKRFRVRFRKQKCWRTNERTELHQFWKEPSYDGDLSPGQVWIRLDTAFSSYSPETEMLTDRQTNRQNYTNFERNLAMMVLYFSVKFEFDWTQRFRVTVRKQKCWRTDTQTKNGETNRRNYTNFERNLAVMVIYVPVKFEFDWTKRFQVKSPETKMWMDRQTDVGHINLIGGLVTRNPPKNSFYIKSQFK